MAIADNMPNDRPQDQARRIADLERAVRELRAARSLDQGTITATAGLGVRTSNFDGTDFAHPGTQGNYFGGDGLVANSLYLRPGSVSNDALTSPVSPLIAHTDGTNFSLATGANVAKLTITIPVPSGYSKALVVANANMNANNNTGAGDYAYLGMRINGSAVGWSLAAYAAPLIYCAVSNSASSLLTSLGSSFTVQATASSAAANWAADANNTINLDAIVLFLR